MNTKYLIKLKRFFHHIFSEKTIIPWMMTAAIIPMILVSFFAYEIAKDILDNAINNALTTGMQRKIEFIDRYISERKLDIIQISELPDLINVINKLETKGENATANDEVIKSFTQYVNYLAPRMGLINLYIIDTEGKVIYSLTESPLLGVRIQEGNSVQPDLYQAFEGAKILQIPYLFVQNKTKTPRESLHIYLSNPIRENDQMKAILVMRLDLGAIERMINRLFGYSKSEKTLLATIINNEPTIIMSTKKTDEASGTKMQNAEILQLFRKAIRGESGEPTTITLNGKQIVAIYRYVPQLNMGMLIHYDKKEAYQRIHWLRISVLTLTSISLILAAAIVFWISRALWQANIKSELLLENILPKFVIDELKEKKQFAARNVHNVSILFVDIVNFTSYASSKTPETVVNVLDEIFSIFDQLTEKYQLEKIKTIGDAYMAVAGLTSAQTDHANRALDLGLAMISTIQRYNIDHHTHFSLRGGIGSGTITAGIIGKKKFSYDLWGNTVNLASRMESTGIENVVQITQDTYVALLNKENYLINPRKEVMVKGFGKMNTYIVTEKLP